jgi:hypothetical protein
MGTRPVGKPRQRWQEDAHGRSKKSWKSKTERRQLRIEELGGTWLRRQKPTVKLTANYSQKAICISSRKGSWWRMREMFTLDWAPSLTLPPITLFFLRNCISDWHHKTGLLNLVCVVCNFSKIRSVCGGGIVTWPPVHRCRGELSCSHTTCSFFFMNSHFRMRLTAHRYRIFSNLIRTRFTVLEG